MMLRVETLPVNVSRFRRSGRLQLDETRLISQSALEKIEAGPTCPDHRVKFSQRNLLAPVFRLTDQPEGSQGPLLVVDHVQGH